MLTLNDRRTLRKTLSLIARTFRVGEVDDFLVLENHDLFDPWNGIDTQPLQGVLQTLVIS